MAEWVKVMASDGHELDTYVSKPASEPIGALVVVQEIWGVNAHIRAVADSYAAEGYYVVAPQLFDRIERGIDIGYDDAGRKKAMELYPKLKPELSLLDVAAAFKFARLQDRGTGVVGFCYGGLMAWLAATRGNTEAIEPGCCVGYYAGGIGHFATEEPACPVMLHFGAEDSHIGSDQIDAVRKAHGEHGDVEIFVYEGAGHAFNRDLDPTVYVADAARTARARTLEFLKTHLA